MRGKVARCNHVAGLVGITPAHAGKSCPLVFAFRYSRDHPRTCGEKTMAPLQTAHARGSPPHMRGKAFSRSWVEKEDGITPAHAGKSWCAPAPGCCHGDHPRTCGEKLFLDVLCKAQPGSPPHMRGKVCNACECAYSVGITPAHAGKSAFNKFLIIFPRDHPRTCGEKT